MIIKIMSTPAFVKVNDSDSFVYFYIRECRGRNKEDI